MRSKDNEHLREHYARITDFLALSWEYAQRDAARETTASKAISAKYISHRQRRGGEPFSPIEAFCEHYGEQLRQSASRFSTGREAPRELLRKITWGYEHLYDQEHPLSNFPITHQKITLGTLAVTNTLPRILLEVPYAHQPIDVMKALTAFAFVPFAQLSNAQASFDAGAKNHFSPELVKRNIFKAKHGMGTVLGCPAFKEPSQDCQELLRRRGMTPEAARKSYARHVIPDMLDTMRVELPSWLEQTEAEDIREEEQQTIMYGWDNVRY